MPPTVASTACGMWDPNASSKDSSFGPLISVTLRSSIGTNLDAGFRFTRSRVLEVVSEGGKTLGLAQTSIREAGRVP